jgi:4-amino-4-deoxy-L-arabinose transferase-like glycosyltransferase
MIQKCLIIGSLISVAVCSALAFNALTGFSDRTTIAEELLPDRISFGDRHIARAMYLLEHGTLGDEVEPFLGGFARGPVEPVVIATSFFLLGERLWSFWIIQMLFFVGAVLYLYGIGKRFLGDGWFGALPAFMLALFWGENTQVFFLNNEVLASFFITGFAYYLLRYYETERPYFLGLAGALISFLVLAKPIFEYFLPVVVLLLALRIWRRHGALGAMRHGAVFAGALLLIVGGWHVRNHAVLETYRISAGGHAILMRAESALYPDKTIVGFTIASIAGDYIADKFVPGYAALEEPRRMIRAVFNTRRPEMRRSGLTEFQTDEIFLSEATTIIKEHPVRYLALTPAWLFRLNSPPHYRGSSIERMFVGSHDKLPDILKILINALIRIPWVVLMFLGIGEALRRAWRGRQEISFFVLIAVFMLYNNMVYSLLAHAEARYLFPSLPFYFLCLGLVFQRYFLKKPLSI